MGEWEIITTASLSSLPKLECIWKEILCLDPAQQEYHTHKPQLSGHRLHVLAHQSQGTFSGIRPSTHSWLQIWPNVQRIQG